MSRTSIRHSLDSSSRYYADEILPVTSHNRDRSGEMTFVSAKKTGQRQSLREGSAECAIGGASASGFSMVYGWAVNKAPLIPLGVATAVGTTFGGTIVLSPT
jgi:hypothetical protein